MNADKKQGTWLKLASLAPAMLDPSALKFFLAGYSIFHRAPDRIGARR